MALLCVVLVGVASAGGPPNFGEKPAGTVTVSGGPTNFGE